MIYCGSSGRIMEMMSSVREAAELGPHPHLTRLGPIWSLGPSVRRKHHSWYPCGFPSAADWDGSKAPSPPWGWDHLGHTRNYQPFPQLPAPRGQRATPKELLGLCRGNAHSRGARSSSCLRAARRALGDPTSQDRQRGTGGGSA